MKLNIITADQVWENIEENNRSPESCNALVLYVEGEGGVLELLEEFENDLRNGIARCKSEGFNWEQMCMNRLMKLDKFKSQLTADKEEE